MSSELTDPAFVQSLKYARQKKNISSRDVRLLQEQLQRFGLDVYSLTLEEVRISVSRERIRQIEAKALRRLRHRLVHLIRDLYLDE